MRLNLADGTTIGILPGTDAWRGLVADPGLATRVRGALLLLGGARGAVTAPKGFRHVSYSGDIGQEGEKIQFELLRVQADDVRLIVTITHTGFVRVDLQKTGTPRHLAQLRRER